MKPAPFLYRRAETLEHALALLAEHGDEAKLIAGGQSLAAVMNLRLSRPELLIDIDRLPGMSYVLPEDGGVRIGALTRHRHLERYPAPLDGFDLLPAAAELVGHYPIRTRGTFGGSIAHADPAAEWVLVATLLDARIRIAGRHGTRTVPAAEFFHGFFTTAVGPDELVTEVVLPAGRDRSAIAEFARRHGDFAVVAATVAFDLDEDGTIRRPRLALGGVGATAVRVPAAEEMLEGEHPRPELFAAAGQAAARGIDPPADAHGDAGYRRHLTRTLVQRALQEATDARD
ncbi:FAD binding domain-containing protein [Nitriliruptor alkaliphilus]|uniref:FAD binding domain-containing protein n=1 Tax=Nitriliruptor alkaliphilus TaxID=427918 RepID=UPI0006961C1F|nr:xanthine dehydrogenase family protein subunit M [Nitriliruptor alkaliphilus]